MTRTPTAIEEQLAKAGYECALMGIQNGREIGRPWHLDPSNPIHAFENQSADLKADWVLISRAIINELHRLIDTPDIWDQFAGDGLLWKERTSQTVFHRYLDLISPPEEE